MAVLLQAFNDRRKGRVAVKVAGEEEGGLDAVLPECLSDRLITIGKLVAGKDQGQALLGRISPDNGPQVGTYFFPGPPAFPLPSIWCADNR
nr:hypothetical protein [Rufibacter radiotolerans]